MEIISKVRADLAASDSLEGIAASEVRLLKYE